MCTRGECSQMRANGLCWCNMDRNTMLYLFVAIVVVGFGVYFFSSENTGEQQSFSFDPGNASYKIEDKTITLVNGVSETEAAPGSAIKTVTRYFGNETKGDLNEDGREDSAFLITHDSGGSGVFYYIVSVLQMSSGYKPTNAVFVGDRIAPQSTNIIDGVLYVNYAERKPDEPMTAQPSVGVTKAFVVTPEGALVSST